MLRGTSGRVLKPVTKSELGEREIAFYENLRVSVHPTDIEMLRYTPSFYGAKEMRIFDKRSYDYIGIIWKLNRFLRRKFSEFRGELFRGSCVLEYYNVWLQFYLAELLQYFDYFDCASTSK